MKQITMQCTKIRTQTEARTRVCGCKMSIAISQVLASLEPCFYARSIVRMALRRLTEKKHSSRDEFNEK